MAQRKTPKPRISTIIHHIKAGNYDDEMGQLMGAINDRNAVRQQAVLGLVKQVFGPDFDVKPIDTREQVLGRPLTSIDRQPGEVLPGESPHVQDPLGADDDLGPDYESRSPQIGSVE